MTMKSTGAKAALIVFVALCLPLAGCSKLSGGGDTVEAAHGKGAKKSKAAANWLNGSSGKAGKQNGEPTFGARKSGHFKIPKIEGGANPVGKKSKAKGA
jgi:hypothetical protein